MSFCLEIYDEIDVKWVHATHINKIVGSAGRGAIADSGPSKTRKGLRFTPHSFLDPITYPFNIFLSLYLIAGRNGTFLLNWHNSESKSRVIEVLHQEQYSVGKKVGLFYKISTNFVDFTSSD